ncbi:uncharacterized protein BT62DRAFT_911919 [Guyanagaster necrorhizus]|uniref:Uncharacterized protein n=1 Tax=Guyanagaster necrorhizus TaxID=856835 RepID=A0A9P7VFD6_9AGAR|nr:uncharacterized protein BT62DRAFT_911919 [Guyanagaster necrorhizus MCA 3950]KAG7439936.1 hypothetical protein BT62DRAFT_911919 [Guyanagaster necrorhizus MCA 3950]
MANVYADGPSSFYYHRVNRHYVPCLVPQSSLSFSASARSTSFFVVLSFPSCWHYPSFLLSYSLSKAVSSYPCFQWHLLIPLPPVLSHQFYDLASPHIYLSPRQSTKNLTDLPESSIPSACSANCSQDVIKYLSNCSTTACMCNNQTDQSITSCVDCVVAQGNISSAVGKAVIARELYHRTIHH